MENQKKLNEVEEEIVEGYYIHCYTYSQQCGQDCLPLANQMWSPNN